MIGDIEKAVKTLYEAIKNDLPQHSTPDNIYEKMSPYFGIASATADIGDKVMEAIKCMIN